MLYSIKMQLVYLNDDHEENMIGNKQFVASDGFMERQVSVWTARLDMDVSIIESYLKTSEYIVIVSKDINKIKPWVNQFKKKVILLSEYDLILPMQVTDAICLPGDIKKNLIYIILNL